MAILLALLAAGAWGIADFSAGLASRALSPQIITASTQLISVLMAIVAVLLFPSAGPKVSALAWGALSGVGSAVGTLALYHGLAVGRMTVVATLSGVLAAVLPVVVGLALGNSLSLAAAAGIAIAIPAILLVSWRSGAEPTAGPGEAAGGRRRPAGTLSGVMAGLGFGLLFVALDRAGTRSGAWPVVLGQAVSCALIAPLVFRQARSKLRAAAGTITLALGAGVLTGAANLLFLAATGHGELAIVAVLASLYPAVTVLLARLFLAERWSRAQVVGLLAAALAVVLVSAG
jgi:drug/metabolite transporter (DMT)-like permease